MSEFENKLLFDLLTMKIKELEESEYPAISDSVIDDLIQRAEIVRDDISYVTGLKRE